MVENIINLLGENVITIYFIGMCIYYFVKRRNRETYIVLFFVYFSIDLLRKSIFLNFIQGNSIITMVVYFIEGGAFLAASFLYFKKSREQKKLIAERESIN